MYRLANKEQQMTRNQTIIRNILVIPLIPIRLLIIPLEWLSKVIFAIATIVDEYVPAVVLLPNNAKARLTKKELRDASRARHFKCLPKE